MLHADQTRVDLGRVWRAREDISWALNQLKGPEFRGWKSTMSSADVVFRRDGVKFKDHFRHEYGVTVEEVLRTIIAGDRRGHSADLHGLLASLIDSLPRGDSSAVGLELLAL